MSLQIELEREDDGRWIAVIPALPGVLTYGESQESAISRAKSLAFRVIADRIEHREDVPAVADAFVVSS